MLSSRDSPDQRYKDTGLRQPRRGLTPDGEQPFLDGEKKNRRLRARGHPSLPHRHEFRLSLASVAARSARCRRRETSPRRDALKPSRRGALQTVTGRAKYARIAINLPPPRPACGKGCCPSRPERMRIEVVSPAVFRARATQVVPSVAGGRSYVSSA